MSRKTKRTRRRIVLSVNDIVYRWTLIPATALQPRGERTTMERRRYERMAENLSVALLDERSMARGCRGRDVSKGGMLLQFEHPGGAPRYPAGTSVQVRSSLKDGDRSRAVLTVSTVRPVEDTGIGVEFRKPQTELVQLVEPYQLGQSASRRARRNRCAQPAAPQRLH